MDCLQEKNQFSFYDKNEIFQVDTSTIRMAGTNNCGTRMIKIPSLKKGQRAVILQEQRNDDNYCQDVENDNIFFFKSTN
jgi:hypothetical protein